MASATVGKAIFETELRKDGLQRGLGEAEGMFRGTASKFTALGSQLTSSGRALSMGLTVPILAAGTAIISVGKDFESQLDMIHGLVGVSRDQINAWKPDIEGIARSTGIGPVALAEALYFVTSAGIATKDAMSVVEASARASAAGLGETAVIADALTSAMNAYGVENLSASRATDILTAAVKFGKVEADALAPSLGKVIPTASAMGISFEQVAGILAVFSRVGVDASEGTTQLNAVMTALLSSSPMTTRALEGVGLSMGELRDMAAKPGGLVAVMRLLEERFEGNDEGLRRVIPNVRAFRGVMNVLAQDAGTVDEVMREVADSTGDADTAFEAVAKGGAMEFNRTMAELQITAIKMYSSVMPAVARVLGVVRDVLKSAGEWWESLDDSMQDAIVTVAMIAAVLGPLLIVLGLIAGAIGAIIGLLGLLASPVILVALAIAGLVAGAALLLDHFGMLDDALAFLGRMFDDFTFTLRVVGTTLDGLVGFVFNTIGAIVDFAKAAELALKLDWDGASAAAERGMARIEGALESGGKVINAYAITQQQVAEETAARAEESARRQQAALLGTAGDWDKYGATVETESGRASGAVGSSTDAMEIDFADLAEQLDMTEEEAEDMFGGLVSGAHTAGTQVPPQLAKVTRGIGDIQGGLSKLGTDSTDYWESFKNATKNGTETPQERIAALQKQINRLDKVDLPSLSASALAEWVKQRSDAEREVTGQQAFLANHGTILESIIPDALAQARRDGKTEWQGLFSDAKSYSSDIKLAGITAAEGLKSKWVGEMEGLQRGNRVAWDTTGRQSVSAMESIATKAGTYGRNTADAWLQAMRLGIINGKGRIEGAIFSATGALRGYSPPREGPLQYIDKMAEAIATTFNEHFAATIAAGADLFRGALGGWAAMGELMQAASVGQLAPVPGLLTASVPTGGFAGDSNLLPGSANNYQITVQVPPGANMVDVGKVTVEAIREYERANGRDWRGG